jgi:hypothetical protein
MGTLPTGHITVSAHTTTISKGVGTDHNNEMVALPITQDTILVMHLINKRLRATNVRIKNVLNGHPTECLSGRHTSGVGRTQVLSHAILATTTRGSKIILLFKVCT